MRPYEPLNMTTLKWQDITPVDIDLSILVPSQLHLSKTILPKDHSYCGDKYIHVVLFEGVFYISDGHNRVNESKLRGEKIIKARVLIKLGESVFSLSKVA